MSKSTLISRRKFLSLSAGMALGTALAACAPSATSTTVPIASNAPVATNPPAATKPPAATQPPVAMYKEAPMLADLVRSGQLPPIEKRLPKSPLVVKPNVVIGKYGGTFNFTALGPETTTDIQMGMVAGLFRFSDDLLTMTMEVAESYQFSPDAKSCTVNLRQGINWSDGTPFTADDMMFYFEDQVFNKDLSPTLATQWQPGKTPMVVTKVNNYAVKFDFTVPNPAFALIHFAGSPIEAWRPMAWLKKYHLKYNPNADTEAKAKGFDDWKAYFLKLSNWNYGVMAAGIPVLGPWRPVKNDSQRRNYDRNPYYWKVDTGGNQLPYVDYVIEEYVSSLDVANLRAISGEVTLDVLDLLVINYPVLKQGEKAGNYTIKNVFSERGADVAIAFNQLHKDPVLKKIFGEVKFRQAVSVAINRKEINDLVFLGLATPRQATINETASFFKQEWADNYAQFDTNLANKLLDEIGLDKKDADGWRMRPDGKVLEFSVEYLPQEGPKKQTMELVVKHWAKVGVKAAAAERDRAFLITRLNASDHDCSAWHVDRQLERASYAYGSTQKLGPGGDSAITWAKPWRDWFISGSKSGSEPPQEAKDLFDAYGAWQQTSMGTPEYAAAGIKVHDLIAKNLWVIGTVGQGPIPLMIKNTLENVFVDAKKRVWYGAAMWGLLPDAPEQWFFKA